MMIALLVNPARYTQSVLNGMLLYAATVMPTMLPFFFLSGIMTGTGIASKTAKCRLAEKLFGAPNAGLYVLLMACLSGYPVGAKLTAELYEQGILDEKGAAKLVPFTSATGPLFMVGTVGSAILGDYRCGLCILSAHYLATVANGFLFRGKKKSATINKPLSFAVSDKLLWDAAYNTVISLFVAGVFVVCFNLFADVLDDIGLIALLAKALGALGLPETVGEGLGYGLCEMTRGCVVLAKGLPLRYSTPLCCLVVTLGGACVAAQSIAYLSKCHVKPLYFLLCKITQSTIAFGLCALFCLLL